MLLIFKYEQNQYLLLFHKCLLVFELINILGAGQPSLISGGLVGTVDCFGHMDFGIKDRLSSLQIPIVSLNEPGLFNVSFDMRADILRAVADLQDRGHHRFAFFNCSVYQVFTQARQGFLEAIENMA